MDKTPLARISQHDLARHLSISTATVSRALRDDPRISAAVRQCVRSAAAALGYRPDPMLAALAHYRRGRSPRSFGGVIAWINTMAPPEALRHRYPEFNLYWLGAKRSADKFGYRLEEFVANEATPLPRIETILRARGVQGLLLPPEPHAPADWSRVALNDFAVVRLSRSVHEPNAHLVMPDQVANAILAFERMLAMGYRRIGYVGAPLTSVRLFGAGFLCAQQSLPPRGRLPPLFSPPGDQRDRHSRLVAWLRRTKPDAIIEDGLEAEDLRAVGYRVPKDVGIANLNFRGDVPVAGIDQNLEEVGRVAVLMLISLIHDNARGRAPIVRQNLVSGRWVDGPTLPPRG